MTYVPVIGLEVHLQLATRSKIFCGCATTFGAAANSQVCPVCLGFPGVLPVLNRKVLALGIRTALALGCRIEPTIVFHRKNYFYPDLPKDFQISQYDLPLGRSGSVEVGERRIRVHRVHLEEDAGKLIHKEGEDASLVDFNRSGMPLLEIVSEPDLASPEEAQAYLKTLKAILQYLEVSDCDMEKGSLRCDTNVSLRRPSEELGTKVEVKNLNSFKSVGRALTHEIERQGKLLEAGEKVAQETRLFDDARGITLGMRSKEYAHDYRYFPEPDLVPFSLTEKEIEVIREELPELPAAKAKRFAASFGLTPADARGVTASRAAADYFEACVKAVAGAGLRPEPGTFKAIANWILGEIARVMNERNLEEITALQFSPGHLLELVQLVDSGKISHKMAKEVFAEVVKSGESPARHVQARNLAQVTDAGRIRESAQAVIQENPGAVEDFKKGKPRALMFLVGQLMRRTQGSASPALAQETLRELLKENKR
ncbi:MAG: Asp-tRNA(Asn)/Glu-tRNA(Gln) amidotransferase subunit GatB [Candidatus Omnitrophica bacterium]|nr:Asp-tRNA(Asn)/Glu-tRNA(Gln) amidotransferase subunit GatB [Candidatus Omnitrophota bacterium]